jgi:hypothetical protein
MIIINNTDGSIARYPEYEFVGTDEIRLYDPENQTGDRHMQGTDIRKRLETGGYFENRFPIAYDTVHGPLNGNNIRKYGVPVRDMD